MNEGPPPRVAWSLVLGFSLWCSALVMMYAAHAVGCAFGWPAGALRLGLGLALLAHLGAIGWLWRAKSTAGPDPASGPAGAFLHQVAIGASAAAFVTVVVTLGPALLLQTCV